MNTPIQNLEQKETMAHYNAVMLEDLHSKMDLLLEGFQANSERLTAVENGLRSLSEDMIDMERRICSKINRITERCERHDCRLDALEANT